METQSKCQSQLFDGQGSTHFNTTGALLVARECARLMKAQGILADNIVLPTDLSVSPATGDLGEAYKGQTLQKEFTLNGFGLSPENGHREHHGYRRHPTVFRQERLAAVTVSRLRSSTLMKTFYAQMALTENGDYTGTITVLRVTRPWRFP